MSSVSIRGYLYSHTGSWLSDEDIAKFIPVYIINKIDYCNSLLYSMSDNETGRILTKNSKQCNSTPLLKMLHWIHV